ncbi:divergent serine/threonine protein kinase [Insectomime virus]|nr:divergent serine/threonine protein kinase [Insectomime virus]
MLFHTITVKCEGEEHKFAKKDQLSAQAAADEFLLKKAKLMSHKLEQPGQYVKLVVLSEDEQASPEVEYYEYLEGLNITPKLLSFGSLFSFQTVYKSSGLSFDSHYSYMVFEKFGESLDETYGPSIHCMNSSEELLASSRLFDRIFPHGIFPQKVRDSIRNLLEELSEMLVEHQDIHSGNILMGEDGTLKLIDFEYAEFL